MEIINEEVVKRQKKIAKHYAAIKDIQDTCTHPKETLYYVNESNTGNYDPSEDCYWAVYSCHLCGKVWSDDQSKYAGIRGK